MTYHENKAQRNGHHQLTLGRGTAGAVVLTMEALLGHGAHAAAAMRPNVEFILSNCARERVEQHLETSETSR